jgi:hypothetical protein
MAALLDLNNGQKCFLYAHHSFGRLPHAVDTLLNSPLISKHHAIIDWYNNKWTIRDLSRNGSWLNGNKLQPNQRYQLKVNDQIYFANADKPILIVQNLDAPADFLICLDPLSEHVISLNKYHLLPDEHNPQVVVYLDPTRQQWCFESIKEPTGEATWLNEHDLIRFNDCSWRLQLSHLAIATESLQDQQLYLDELNFIFELSQDEETTELRVKTSQGIIDFSARNHHYLTLHLARQRIVDINKGIDQQMQGWVHTQQLSKDMGMDINHLNIQVHRARKQLSDKLNLIDSQYLIQRQAGKLRFGPASFQIYKNHQFECGL